MVTPSQKTSALKVVREKMVELVWSRKYVNRHVDRTRKMFQWGVSEKLVPREVYGIPKLVLPKPISVLKMQYWVFSFISKSRKKCYKRTSPLRAVV
jgi:hypothetical protein